MCIIVLYKPVRLCGIGIPHVRFGEQEDFVRGIVPTLCSIRKIIGILQRCAYDCRLFRSGKGAAEKVLLPVVHGLLVAPGSIAVQPAPQGAGLPGDTFRCRMIPLVIEGDIREKQRLISVGTKHPPFDGFVSEVVPGGTVRPLIIARISRSARCRIPFFYPPVLYAV